jgi:hypothetical protein
MNNKISIYLFLIFALVAEAQVIGDIKSKSSQNKSNHSSGGNSGNSSRSSGNSSPSYSSGSSTYNNTYSRSSNNSNYNNSSDGCADGCTSGCTDFVNLFDILATAQKKILGRKDSVPEVVSLEVYNELSTALAANTIIYSPRFRANLGIVSTEMRFYTLYENKIDGGWDKYSLFDWQVIQFNLSAIKEFKLRAGLGFTYEKFSQMTFFDWGASTDIYPTDKFRIRLDFRKNYDFVTNLTPRLYFGGGLDFKIFGNSSTKLVGFLGLNANYTCYYNSISQVTVGPTLYFRIQ